MGRRSSTVETAPNPARKEATAGKSKAPICRLTCNPTASSYILTRQRLSNRTACATVVVASNHHSCRSRKHVHRGRKLETPLADAYRRFLNSVQTIMELRLVMIGHGTLKKLRQQMKASAKFSID